MTRRARALLVLSALVSLAAAFRADLEIAAVGPGVYRGHVPTRDADFAELRRLGIRTIVDIRGNTPLASLRERHRAEQHGFAYIHVRMGFRPLRDGTGDRALAVLADEANYPLYLHCELDRDRTSALVAAYRVQVQGWDIPSAEAEARDFGIRRYFVGLNRYVRAGGIR
jgi:protein tyrosine/serine phosphatase